MVHKRKLEGTGTERHEVVQRSCQVRCYPLLGGLRDAGLFRKNASVEYLSIWDLRYMKFPTSRIGLCILEWLAPRGERERCGLRVVYFPMRSRTLSYGRVAPSQASFFLRVSLGFFVRFLRFWNCET